MKSISDANVMEQNVKVGVMDDICHVLAAGPQNPFPGVRKIPPCESRWKLEPTAHLSLERLQVLGTCLPASFICCAWTCDLGSANEVHHPGLQSRDLRGNSLKKLFLAPNGMT